MSEYTDLFTLAETIKAYKLAAAVEYHGIHANRFGKWREFKPGSPEAGEILSALASQCAWANSPEDGTQSPIDEALMFGEASPYRAGWPADKLPDFAAIPDTKPVRQSSQTKTDDSAMLLLASLAITFGIDVRKQGATTELEKALQFAEFGKPSRNTIDDVLARCRAAIDRRGK